MNLTPAEDWDELRPLHAERETRLASIRQIQADALRRGAYRCQMVANIHSNPSLASVAQNLADELNKEANQLHPLPEPNPSNPVTYRMAFKPSGIPFGKHADDPVVCNCKWDNGHEPHCHIVKANEFLSNRSK